MHYKKHWKRTVSFVNKKLRKQTLASEKLNKIDQCLYQVVLFVVKKNQNSLKLRSEWIFGEISGQNFIM